MQKDTKNQGQSQVALPALPKRVFSLVKKCLLRKQMQAFWPKILRFGIHSQRFPRRLSLANPHANQPKNIKNNSKLPINVYQ